MPGSFRKEGREVKEGGGGGVNHADYRQKCNIMAGMMQS